MNKKKMIRSLSFFNHMNAVKSGIPKNTEIGSNYFVIPKNSFFMFRHNLLTNSLQKRIPYEEDK